MMINRDALSEFVCKKCFADIDKAEDAVMLSRLLT